MGTVTILSETTKRPITMIGQMAGVCWGADTSDDAKNYKRGWDCITSGHGRTLEYPDIYMILDGYSARVMREWYTHIGGAPTRLQASTRYIDYRKFDYIIPPSIEGDTEAKMRYISTMDTIRRTTAKLEEMGLPREDIANLLPLGMTTRVVDRRNLRNLIDMSRQRMCNRALWEYRELFDDILDALGDYSEEWRTLTNNAIFRAKCELTHTCHEKHGCGKYPSKEG